MVLAAGREVPQEKSVRWRGEGVAIVLSGTAVRAWRSACNQWKALNSRLVTTIYTGSWR